MLNLLSTLWLCTSLSWAQNDDQLWSSVSTRYRPRKRMRIDLNQHLRIDRDITRIGSVITEGEIAQSFKNGLRFGLAYRFQMSSAKKVQLEPQQRADIYGRFRQKLGKTELSYRLQYQQGYEGDEEQPWKPEKRHRFGIEYDTDTAFTPAISGEIFTKLSPQFSWDKWRGTMALQYKHTKRHIMETYLRMQTPIADEHEPTERIIGLHYQYRFAKKKKKKKKKQSVSP